MSAKGRKLIPTDLTPLLDVIFIMLFMVMIGSTKTAAEKVKKAEAEAEAAKEEKRLALEEMARYDALYSDILTIRVVLTRQEENRVVSIFTQGEELRFPYNWENVNKAGEFTKEKISDILNKKEASSPVILLFEYNNDNIYKSDFDILKGSFTALQGKYTNLFVHLNEITSKKEENENG
ncbi:MAG: biopolymer transporter ExbD [Firmicutes bacterium]|nr:biopolymer transporter ExbD [Bacillota bacterium]